MNKSIYTNKLLLLLLVLLSQHSFAQTSTSWKGTTSTSWNLASNWSNGIPDSTKDVIIGDANFTGSNQPIVGSRACSNSLTIGGAVTASLLANTRLRIYGNLNIESNGTLSHGSNITINIKGNWSNNGNYLTAVGSTIVTSQTNGTIQEFGGDSVTNFRKLYIYSGSKIVLTNNLNISGSGAVFTVAGEVNPGVIPSYKITSNVSCNVDNGGKLIVNTSDFTENYNFTGVFNLNNGSIVDYASTVVDQIVSSAYTYSTLMISGSGVKSLTASLPLLYSRSSDAGNLIIKEGTFDMGSFSVNRGRFTTGGIISLAAGAVLKTSGASSFPSGFSTKTFSSGSLVDYNGTNQTISSQTYGNLLLEGGGTKSASLSFAVAGDLTIQSGALSTSTNAITVSIQGGFTMNGGSISGTNAIYEFNGTADQTINLLSSLVNMTINKTSGNLILSSDVTVTNNLKFTSGIIQTDNNNMIISSSASISNASQSTGWVYGNLKESVATGASVSKKFEIGTATYYSPATLNASSVTTGGSLIATIISNDHPEIDYSGVNPLKSVNQYWSFTNQGIVFSRAAIVFEWNAAQADAGVDVNNFLSGKFDGSVWTKYTPSTEVANSITISNITVLEDFVIGEKITKYHWTGADYTTDWFTPRNWYGGLPDSSSDVTIPNPLSGRRNYPTLVSAQEAKVGDLTIDSDGALYVDDATIKIYGNASSTGIFDVTNATVEFSGITGQTIASGLFYTNKIKNLTLSNDVTLADTDSITGTLTINDGKTLYTNDNLVLKSDANGTARIAPLPVDGLGKATAIIIGKASIERFIPMRKAWRLLSVPVRSSTAPTICGAWQENAYSGSLISNVISNPNPTLHYGVHITGGATANGFDQSPTNLSSVKYYDNTTNTFSGLPTVPGTIRPITDYNGYMVYIRGDRSINLSLGLGAAITETTLKIKGDVNTGNQTFDVNAHNFTILGNPYPAEINFATITKSNVKNSFYIWDPKLAGSQGLGAYVTVSYNASSGLYDVTTSSSPISQYIPSGEAVIIESEDGTNPGSLIIKESDKSTNGSDFVFGRSNNTAKSLRVNLYEKETDGTYGLLDGSMTTFHSNNFKGYDKNDVSKLNGAGESISFRRDGHSLAIERKNDITGIDTSFINLAQTKKQQYRLDIVAENMTNEDITATVKDNYSATTNNIKVDLGGSTHVEFTINEDPASYAADRFSIVYNTSSTTPVVKTQIKTIETSAKTLPVVLDEPAISIYPNPVIGNEINIKLNNMETGNYNLKLYNIAGQVVASQNAKYASKGSSMKLQMDRNLAPGKYEIKLEGNGKTLNTSLIKQ